RASLSTVKPSTRKQRSRPSPRLPASTRSSTKADRRARKLGRPVTRPRGHRTRARPRDVGFDEGSLIGAGLQWPDRFSVAMRLTTPFATASLRRSRAAGLGGHLLLSFLDLRENCSLLAWVECQRIDLHFGIAGIGAMGVIGHGELNQYRPVPVAPSASFLDGVPRIHIQLEPPARQRGSAAARDRVEIGPERRRVRCRRYGNERRDPVLHALDSVRRVLDSDDQERASWHGLSNVNVTPARKQREPSIDVIDLTRA